MRFIDDLQLIQTVGSILIRWELNCFAFLCHRSPKNQLGIISHNHYNHYFYSLRSSKSEEEKLKKKHNIVKLVANHWCQYLPINFKTKTHSPKVECPRATGVSFIQTAFPRSDCGNEHGSELFSLNIKNPLHGDVEQLLLPQLGPDPHDLVVVGGHHSDLCVRHSSPFLGPISLELRQPE